MEHARPFTIEGDGIRLTLRVKPRAGRNALEGLANIGGRTALQVRLAAVPVDGAANKALIAFMATTLGVRKSDIEILSGDTNRLKLLHIAGDTARLSERIAAILAE